MTKFEFDSVSDESQIFVVVPVYLNYLFYNIAGCDRVCDTFAFN